MHDKYYVPKNKKSELRTRLTGLERSIEASNTNSSNSDEFLNIGDLLEFDPHDPSKYPRVGGIYVLYDIADRPLYIGQGRAIDKRIRNHFEKFWFKPPIVESASYVRVENKTLRERIEAVLIRFLKSNAIINKRFVDR